MCEDSENETSATLAALPSFGDPPKIYGTPYADSSLLRSPAKSVDDFVNDDEIEFSFKIHESDTCFTINADEIFSDGRIRPAKTLNSNPLVPDSSAREKSRRPQLVQFLRGERFGTSNRDSSSSADELEGVAPGSYCLWSPGKSPDVIEKSFSTDSLFRCLVRDSGHNWRRIVFNWEKKKKKKKKRSPEKKGDRKEKGEKGNKTDQIAASRLYYDRNGYGDSRKSYLPYKTELIWACSDSVDQGCETRTGHRPDLATGLLSDWSDRSDKIRANQSPKT